MNKLNYAGVLAIPLKANLNSPITAAQPNFMVVDGMHSPQKGTLPQLGQVMCINTVYKLVYREVLEENQELGRPEEVREVIWEYANQLVPMSVSEALSSYEVLSTKVQEVNYLLSLFQFRGVLSGFVLEIDTEKLDEYVAEEIASQPQPEPENDPEPES